uniref:Tyrosine-protein kinase receptor n=1 Tax=Gasterosteus aculeatus aculeatus TaxID=481459 RepID=A0AAQ4RT06_GASAC
MDYIKNTYLSIFILIVAGTCNALLDRFLAENYSDQRFLHHLDSEDDIQITSCDFETVCHWTLSNHGDQSDWSVGSPRQPESTQTATMPVTDHSVGSSDGHFLLLSSWASAEAPGRCEHHLTSPVLPGSDGRCILQVAVYESSPAVGNLSLLIKPVDSGSAGHSVDLHRRTPDNRRADWEVLQNVIGQVDEPFQVILRYTSCLRTGEGTLALDSLEFIDCESDHQFLGLEAACGESFHCENSGVCIDQSQVCNFHTDCPLGEDEGFICGALPFGSHCSFEEDECGWSASSQHSAWRRVAGHEFQEREDMQGVTLQRTPGHFLFLQVRESNSLREASIQSSSFHPIISTAACQLRFSLYLRGNFNGTLLVAIEEKGTGAAPLVWERNDQWKDDWEDVALQLTGLQHGFHVKVTAVWEKGSNADVALDDIAIGAACFETDLNSLLPLGHSGDFLSALPEPSASEVSLMTWLFNSCGASGPLGPTQAQCDSTYRNQNVSVTVGKEDPLKGVQMWRVPATNRYLISAYGAAGGKGAKNHNKRNHGVFISGTFPLEKGDILYILVGHQGEDACPGRNPHTQRICLGESSVIEDKLRGESGVEWAGGGGGGGGATYIFKMEGDDLVPLLVAAGGGGNAYLEDPESSLEKLELEQYENSTMAPSTNGQTGAAGGGGACTAGGGGGGYRGGDAALKDEITSDGQNGISFIHPMGEIFLQPLAAMESHGDCEIKVHLNCSHCETRSCKREKNTQLILCLCEDDNKVLASDNVTCVSALDPDGLQGKMSTSFILAVVVSTVASGVALIGTAVILMWYRRKNNLDAVNGHLWSPEYKLSKLRSSTIMTDYNPNYCFAGKAACLNELKEVPRKNITLLRALGHGAFGEVYEGQVLGMSGDNSPLQVAIKTLPEICSEQDEMDFLMEALIMSKFSHDNIVRCIGVSLNILPRFILLELMTGGDMKSFLRQNRPRAGQTSSLTMRELLQMARDIAFGCRYLEENHFIHRDIAARNCLLTCPGPDRVAKIGDFGMARDIYRASYYRKGGRAMLPVKWMPPEAFMEGVFTCKTDTWSFGVLLWEILSLGFMPYPCKTNQEVLEFVTSGGRMDPPKSCPGPVYRIMTQCWQHCPEHRPNFSTILERIDYCSQDPDVINTPLPVEYAPAADDKGGPTILPSDLASLTPLLVSHPVSQAFPSQLGVSSLGLGPTPLPPQPTKPRVLLQRTQPVHQEVTSCREALQPCWAEPVPAPGLPAGGHWLHPEPSGHQPCSRNSSSSGSQRLKNKTKNLWNPTYGSWVLESFRGKKTLAHTQSMPLSSSATTAPNTQAPHTCNANCEHNEAECNSAHPPPPGLCTSSTSSPSGPTKTPPSTSSHKTPTSGPVRAGTDLAKLQSFPCGNVNYAYDEQSYEAESAYLGPSQNPRGPSKTAALPPWPPRGAALGLAFGLTPPPLVCPSCC